MCIVRMGTAGVRRSNPPPAQKAGTYKGANTTVGPAPHQVLLDLTDELNSFQQVLLLS